MSETSEQRKGNAAPATLRAGELIDLVRRELRALPPELRAEVALDVALAAAGVAATDWRTSAPSEQLLRWGLTRLDRLPPERRAELRTELARALMRCPLPACMTGPVESPYCRPPPPRPPASPSGPPPRSGGYGPTGGVA